MKPAIKYCPKCKETKSLKLFYYNQYTETYSGYCKKCSKKYTKDRLKSDKLVISNRALRSVAADILYTLGNYTDTQIAACFGLSRQTITHLRLKKLYFSKKEN